MNGADLKLSNKKSKYAKKRYLFATYGFCHKPHILLHNSFLLSYYFWKSINKWWNGTDLKLALWAMGKTEKGHISGKKIQNSKKQYFDFWRVIRRVLCPNFKFLAQTMLAVAMTHTYRVSHILCYSFARLAFRSYWSYSLDIYTIYSIYLSVLCVKKSCRCMHYYGVNCYNNKKWKTEICAFCFPFQVNINTRVSQKAFSLSMKK